MPTLVEIPELDVGHPITGDERKQKRIVPTLQELCNCFQKIQSIRNCLPGNLSPRALVWSRLMELKVNFRQLAKEDRLSFSMAPLCFNSQSDQSAKDRIDELERQRMSCLAAISQQCRRVGRIQSIRFEALVAKH